MPPKVKQSDSETEEQCSIQKGIKKINLSSDEEFNVDKQEKTSDKSSDEEIIVNKKIINKSSENETKLSDNKPKFKKLFDKDSDKEDDNRYKSYDKIKQDKSHDRVENKYMTDEEFIKKHNIEQYNGAAAKLIKDNNSNELNEVFFTLMAYAHKSMNASLFRSCRRLYEKSNFITTPSENFYNRGRGGYRGRGRASFRARGQGRGKHYEDNFRR